MRPPLRPPGGRFPRVPAAAAAFLACFLAMPPAALLQGCARPAQHPYAEPEGAESARESLPAAFRQEPLVMLSDSTWLQAEVSARGNRLVRRNVSWYRVLRGRPDLLGTLTFWENDMLQERGAIRVDAYEPGRKPWSITGEGMKLVRPRPEGLYVEPGGYYRTATLPRYGEGLLVRVENRDAFTRPEFMAGEPLRGAYPCLRRYVAFSAPAGHGFRVELRNREGLSLAADTAELPDGRVEIRVSGSDLPKLMPARSPRFREEWYAALRFSVPPKGNASLDWAGVGDHYLELMKGSRAGSAELDAAAAALAGGSPEATAGAAFALVKSRVRYLGDFRGLNAWVPREPGSVWENGYGDCKEMANLLRVLAAGKGVEGGLALVRASGGPQLVEAFPALDGFDHAVYWHRRADGSVAYLDPTMPGGTGRDSYLHLLGRKVLRIAPGASRVDTVRPAPGYRNRVTTASALEQRPGGGWELSGRIGLKGKVAQDLWLDLAFHPGKDEARALVKRFLSGRFGLQAEEFSWTAPSADSVEIRYAQSADAMALALDRKALQVDLPRLYREGGDMEEQEGEWRAFAFEQSDAWTLPEGYRKLRDAGMDADPGRGRWSLSGATVRREFRMDDGAFPPEDLEARRRWRESLSRFSVATVWR